MIFLFPLNCRIAICHTDSKGQDAANAGIGILLHPSECEPIHSSWFKHKASVREIRMVQGAQSSLDIANLDCKIQPVPGWRMVSDLRAPIPPPTDPPRDSFSLLEGTIPHGLKAYFFFTSSNTMKQGFQMPPPPPLSSTSTTMVFSAPGFRALVISRRWGFFHASLSPCSA